MSNDVKKVAGLVAAGVGALLVAWASFNAGFEYGADTAACVTFTMATDIAPEENTFCEAAKDITVGEYIARDLWLHIIGDHP